MNTFYGEEKCLIDANGRLKLCPRFWDLFRAVDERVVFHCLPEGALGVYPPPAWSQMRDAQASSATHAGGSLLERRHLRRFGALTHLDRISNQGRLTIPAQFRERLGLLPGTEVVTVGCEIGVEIWTWTAWQAECEEMIRHELERGRAEMQADISNPLSR